MDLNSSKENHGNTSDGIRDCLPHASKRLHRVSSSSSRSSDSSASKPQRQLRPRRLPSRFYSISRTYSSRENHERKCRFVNRQSRAGHRLILQRTKKPTNDEILADEEIGENDDKETRRYPVRNRRHTDVYQGKH